MNFSNKLEFESYISESYKKVGITDDSIVYLYTDFRVFGVNARFYKTKDDFCFAFLKPLLERGITVFCAAFSYTFNGVFNVLETSTELGLINKWFLKQVDVTRSEHPVFSYAGIGPQRNLLLNIGKSAFGKHSIFDRLEGKKAVVLHIGRPIKWGSTMLHYVEQLCGASYRSNICFHTKVYRGDLFIGQDYSAMMKKKELLHLNLKFNFEKAEIIMRQNQMIKDVGEESSLSFFSSYLFDDTLDLLVNSFYKDPTIFLKINYISYE